MLQPKSAVLRSARARPHFEAPRSPSVAPPVNQEVGNDPQGRHDLHTLNSREAAPSTEMDGDAIGKGVKHRATIPRVLPVLPLDPMDLWPRLRHLPKALARDDPLRTAKLAPAAVDSASSISATSSAKIMAPGPSLPSCATRGGCADRDLLLHHAGGHPSAGLPAAPMPSSRTSAGHTRHRRRSNRCVKTRAA